MKEFWLNLTLEGEDGSFDCFPADPLKDGEVDPKHLLRLIDFKSYQSLQEKYDRAVKGLKEIYADGSYTDIAAEIATETLKELGEL